MTNINILCIGDIVGQPGRDFLFNNLKSIQKDQQIHITIANIENAAAGFGVTTKVYDQLKKLPIDLFTSGNHIYDKKDIIPNFNKLSKLIRPINFPKGNPGIGLKIIQFNDYKIAVINAIGRVFMGLSDCPFQKINEVLPDILKETPIVIVDFHAEATSEKQGFGWFLDGKVSCVFGTHTHVMTADNQILTNGTAYISDIGMVGAKESILGMQKDNIIQKFLDQMPTRFEPPKTTNVIFNAIKLNINSKTGKANSIEKIQLNSNEIN